MSDSLPADRPVTSKSRGICRYYNTSRGCYAGNSCKFLHGEAEKYTPFDKNKTCRYYAAGFCRRGENCWYLHTRTGDAPKSEDDEYDVCCICYEKPVTYGLLEGCSHQYCVKCIREWRDLTGKSEEVASSGVVKKCPLCRAPSRFVTPSSHFYPNGHPGKKEVIERYKATMARISCRHFQKSPPGNRFCPFGKECFYQHLNEDGTPYTFEFGADYHMEIHRARQMDRRFSDRRDFYESDFDDMLDNLAGFNVTFNALRSAAPGIGPEFVDAAPSPPEDENEEAGVVNGLRADTMQRLVNLMANIEEFFELNGHFVESNRRDGAQQTQQEVLQAVDMAEVELTVSSLFPAVPEEPVPSALPALASLGDPLESPALNTGNDTFAPDSSASLDSNPRFSTVVRGRGRFVTEPTSGDLDEGRALPAAAVVHSEAEDTAEAAQPVAVVDESPTHATETSPSFAEDIEQKMQEVLLTEDPSGNTADVTTSPAASAESQSNQAMDAAVDFAALHDADPPFLTDGRGRVVWTSTTAAARYRESRRARAIAPSSSVMQHKTSDAARASSRPRHLVRAHTYPEGSQEHAASDTISSTFLMDGRGHLVPSEADSCCIAQDVNVVVASTVAERGLGGSEGVSEARPTNDGPSEPSRNGSLLDVVVSP